MTGAAHLVQTFLAKNQSPVVARNVLEYCRHFLYNENLMRALNTTSLKCYFPSNDAIERQEKIHICI